MIVFVGGGELKKVFLGNTEIKKIYVGDNLIYPKEWSPGSNTVAYYQFNSNLNDSSGNNRNLSMLTGSFSYGTLSSGLKYVQTNKTSQSTETRIPYSKNNFTLSFWLSFESVTNVNGCSILEIHSGGSDGILRPVHNRGKYPAASTRVYLLNNDSLTYTPSPVGSWHLYTVTCSNNIMRLYVDGNLIGSDSAPMPNTTNPYFKINGVWNNSTYNYLSQDKLALIIIENIARDISKIKEYYSITKSLFGIS